MNLKPLGDRVVIKQDEAEQTTASGLYIASETKEKPSSGIVLAVAVHAAGVVLLSPTFTVFLCLTAANIPMSLLAVFLSRNMLDTAEMNMQ